MTRPNVLLICVEHWPGSLLGVAGHPCVMTPTLDQLAYNGVRFTNAYSATPTCIPARASLMTGTTARTHGDRVFKETKPMADLPTMAGAFAGSGYQCYAVGKLHVYPQRDRIGFHDVLLNEESRHHLGAGADDYELFLADQGFTGQELTHGMSNNDYMTRPWHLPEYCHHTNWTAREMCRVIKRRDPTRPAFWYMSFIAAHPPIVPPAPYLDMYRDAEIPPAKVGHWAGDFDKLPYTLKAYGHGPNQHGHPFLANADVLRRARAAYYAMCTHVDHQMRLVIGMLREQDLLDQTIVMFIADHGEMLGHHGLFAKGLMYEDSAKIPMILVPTADYRHLGHHVVDDRLVELRDVMPTLLDMAGVPIASTVEGLSLLGDEAREYLYGEHFEDDLANRMIRDQRHKLIYYPVGNHTQLFDLAQDPDELCNLADDSGHAQIRQRLTDELIKHLYGDDLNWVRDGQLVGTADKAFEKGPNRGMGGQRGWRFV